MARWAYICMFALCAAAALASHARPPTWEQASEMPANLRTQFHTQVLGKRATQQQRLQDIVDFMLGPQGLALEYNVHATHTVAETYANRRGNCLSFTLMFIVLAREAGLDAYAQEADQVLAWMEEGRDDLVYHAGHVNVGVRIWQRRFVVDFDRTIVAAVKPRPITDQRLLAHVYNNRAAEQMVAGDLEGARQLLGQAFGLEPRFLPALNNYGVLHARAKNISAAEQAYATALALQPDHIPTLTNLALLYRQSGELSKALLYEKKRAESLFRDPYYHYARGLQHEKGDDIESALHAYTQALRLNNKEPRFFLAVARLLQRLGDEQGAARALERARLLSKEHAVNMSSPVYWLRQ